MAIGIGIVGAGMISRFHAKALKEVKGAKLVACYNRSLDKAEALAKEFGCTAHDSLEAMLAEIVIDQCEAKGYPRVEIVDLPMRPGEQPGAVVSADAETLRAVGIDPADLVSLETGLERTVDWFIATQGEHWTAPESLALATR